jgi:hypothetical protein
MQLAISPSDVAAVVLFGPRTSQSALADDAAGRLSQ